jgi:hypothetical protein
MAKKQFELMDLLHELEKVRLEPLVIPTLMMVDPILAAIPQGAIKSFLDRQKPREGQFTILEKLVPYSPWMIKIIGVLARSKVIIGLYTLLAFILTPIIKTVVGMIKGVSKVVQLLKHFNRSSQKEKPDSKGKICHQHFEGNPPS